MSVCWTNYILPVTAVKSLLMSNALLQRSLFQIQYCAVTKRNKLLFLNCMVKDIKALMCQILKKTKNFIMPN